MVSVVRVIHIPVMVHPTDELGYITLAALGALMAKKQAEAKALASAGSP